MGKTVSSDLRAKKCIKIRKARKNDIQKICHILSESFEPYRQYYTEEAYEATVLSPREIEKRVANQHTDVLVTILANQIVGTASIIGEGKANLHVLSMAVEPKYQRKGVGWRVLEEINRLAKRRHCNTITLECFEPLTKAVNLYEKFGFRKTGRLRTYYGIKIFEMRKSTRK